MSPPSRRRWGSGDGPEWFPPAAKPIKVEGGLVARSSRGGIGEQWWSRRFLAVMESFALGTRLTRGRNYARRGQVISLDVEPGAVSARVQGSRVTPYKVRIGLPTFSELVWAKAEVVLAEQAIHSARLLAGDFPPELEPVFAGIGAPLFPARLGDLAMSCSCPDDAVPCKHLAAAFYLLAERFDDDPFLILRWRGRPREALLRRLRELRGSEPAGGGGGGGESVGGEVWGGVGGGGGLGGGVGGGQERGGSGAGGDTAWAGSQRPVLSAALALVDTPEQLGRIQPANSPGSELAFWTAGPCLPLPSRPGLPVDLLLRQLPTPGSVLGGHRLLAFLAPLYEQLPSPAPLAAPPRPAASPAAPPSRPARVRPAGKTPETHRRPRHGNLGS